MKHVEEFKSNENIINEETDNKKYLSSQIEMLLKDIRKKDPQLAKILDLIRKEANAKK